MSTIATTTPATTPTSPATSTSPATARTLVGEDPDAPTMLSRTLLELRKLIDTRASLVFLGVMAAMSLAGLGIFAYLDLAADVEGFTQGAAPPFTFLLPVLGVLALTAEWRTGTALWTYSLDPHRTRVFVAKLLALLVVVVTVTLGVLAAAAVATFVVDGTLSGGSDVLGVAGVHAALLLGVTAMGAAVGAALLNTPLAIVTVLLAPQLIPQLLTAFERTAPVVPYVDLQYHLQSIAFGASVEWPHLVSALTVWVLVPLAVGAVRNARRDV